MFRVALFKKGDFDKPRIADEEIINGTVNEDLTQKANSTLTVHKMPLNVKEGDMACIYDGKGIFGYVGVISAIDGTKLSLAQPPNIFADNQLIIPPANQAEKDYYTNNPVSYVSDLYLRSKLEGRTSTDFSFDGNIVFNSFIDGDVKNSYKGITTKVIDNGDDFLPFPVEAETKNLESYLYETYQNYNRIARLFYDGNFSIVLFNPKGQIEYKKDRYWDYNEKHLINEWENIKNLSIVEESVDANTCYVFDKDKSVLRGAFIVNKDGSILEISNDIDNPSRLGTGKTKYVFDDENNPYDLARSELPNIQYNHKITFDITFNDMYSFNDFNLGQPIKFYENGKLHDSLLTGWSYSFDQNSEYISNARFTLGKCRNNLTSFLNKKFGN